MIRCILALLLTTFSVGAASLPIQYEEAFFSAKKIVTSGGGGGSGSGFTLLFKDGACGTINITNAANATTGGTLFVMAVASDNANAGTITVGGDPALTFVAGTPKGFASTFSNQMFYCTNFTPNGAQKFWAHSSASGNLGFLVRAYSGGSQPALFDGEVGTTAATAMTIQPAAFTPSQGELIIESLSYDGGTASIDSGFSFPPDQPAFCANPAMSVLETNNTVHPTWSVGQNANLAATGMMFKTNAGAVSALYMVTGITGSTTRANFTGEVGHFFTANHNLTITKVLRPFVSGNTHTHVITVKDAGCVVIALGTVDMTTSQTTIGGIPYCSATLTSGTGAIVTGQTYSITTVETSGLDAWYDDVNTTTLSSDFGLVKAAFGTCPYSSDGGVTSSFADPSVQYTVP